MSSLYRPLPELIFSTPWFRRLGVNAKLLVLTLAAGPCMTGCPGLAEADAFLLASLTGLAVDDIQVALAEMVAGKVAEVDDDHRLIRLPWLPAMRRTKSWKDVKGWWSCFAQRPDCALRAAHVESLRDAVDFSGENMADTWAETFEGKASASPSQAHAEVLPTPTDHGDGDGDGDGTEEEIAAGAATSPENQPPALKLVTPRTPMPARSKAKANPPRPPLPYSVDELVKTLAAASGGRFVAAKLRKGPAITAQQMARNHSLDQVRLAGEWLSAGGDAWKGVLDVRQLGDLPVWVAHAEVWSKDGRPAIGGKRDGSAPGQPKDAKPNRPPLAEELLARGYGDDA